MCVYVAVGIWSTRRAVLRAAGGPSPAWGSRDRPVPPGHSAQSAHCCWPLPGPPPPCKPLTGWMNAWGCLLVCVCLRVCVCVCVCVCVSHSPLHPNSVSDSIDCGWLICICLCRWPLRNVCFVHPPPPLLPCFVQKFAAVHHRLTVPHYCQLISQTNGIGSP